MSDLSLSYQKVRYDLRPAKQVERLMLIDALRRLGTSGFPVSEYQYTGMGSVHFYDFSLLHRYAGITRMTSVEASRAIERRVKFNCPYALVDVQIARIGTVINELSESHEHLLWLDYDGTIREGYLADVSQAIARLKPGSIILVTVDVEAPKGTRSPVNVREHYQAEFGDLLPANVRPVAFARRNLTALNSKLLWGGIQRGLIGRDDIRFQLLFHFVYEDGHRMLTLGGMLVDQASRERLTGSSLLKTTYVRRRLSDRPYRIRVPVLTRKERLYLDSAMPCNDGWTPSEFEMSDSDLRAYRDIYRFAPQFAELIL